MNSTNRTEGALRLLLVWLILAFIVLPNFNLLYTVFCNGQVSFRAIRKVPEIWTSSKIILIVLFLCSIIGHY